MFLNSFYVDYMQKCDQNSLTVIQGMLIKLRKSRLRLWTQMQHTLTELQLMPY